MPSSINPQMSHTPAQQQSTQQQSTQQCNLRFQRTEQFVSVQERILWYRYLSAPTKSLRNPDLRDQLFEIHRERIEKIAIGFHRAHIPSRSLVSQEDAVQAAFFGAFQAIDGYLPAYGTPFIEWARKRITGEIRDTVRELQDFPRIVARHRRVIRPMIEELEHRLCRKPSIEDIRRNLGSGIASIVSDPLFGAAVYNQAASSPNDESPEEVPVETAKGNVTESCCDARTLKNELENRVLAIFPDRNVQAVVYQYYYLKWSSQKIARNLHVSVSTVSKWRKMAHAEIQRKFSVEEFMEFIS